MSFRRCTQQSCPKNELCRENYYFYLSIFLLSLHAPTLTDYNLYFIVVDGKYVSIIPTPLSPKWQLSTTF